MKRVARIDQLPYMRTLFLRSAPQPMLDFLVAFFARLRTKLGWEIVVEVPDSVLMFDDPEPHHRQLKMLRTMGVVSQYYLERKEYADEPRIHSAIVRIGGRQRMGYSGYGKSLFTNNNAWGPAIGEAVERWSLEHYDVSAHDKRILSSRQIQEQSDVSLLDMAGFSPKTRSQDNGQRTYCLSEVSRFACVKADELSHQRNAFVPLQWFSFAHAARETDRKYEPVLLPLTSSGAATAYSRDEADFRGLLELIERDAFMIHWMKGIVPSKIPIAQLHDPVSERIKSIAERYALDVQFLLLKTDFPVLVVQAIIIDRTGRGPAVVCDSAAGASLEKCMERAFLGAVALRPFIRRKVQEGVPDLEIQKLDMETRALWWSAYEKIQYIEPFISGRELTQSELASVIKSCESATLASLLDVFRKKSLLVFSKDISSYAVQRSTGLITSVVRVPQLIPMHFNEWERCDHGERFTSVPSVLGLEPSDCTKNIPHPYA